MHPRNDKQTQKFKQIQILAACNSFLTWPINKYSTWFKPFSPKHTNLTPLTIKCRPNMKIQTKTMDKNAATEKKWTHGKHSQPSIMVSKSQQNKTQTAKGKVTASASCYLKRQQARTRGSIEQQTRKFKRDTSHSSLQQTERSDFFIKIAARKILINRKIRTFSTKPLTTETKERREIRQNTKITFQL